jgi:uncharacterized membrane protein HdeD (DUF308 family)
MPLHSKTKRSSGTVLLWLGVVSCVAGIVWFFLSGRPIGYSEIIRSKNEDGVIKKSIVCGEIILGWKERSVYLLPLVPGIILIISGRRIRHTNHELR